MNMNPLLLRLLHPFVWLLRFRHRRGYGVHSPFAFDFITDVVYQRLPYYKYRELALQERTQAPARGGEWSYESRKVKRLLFRIVNYCQPGLIVDAGRLAASALYLKAARAGADYTPAADLSELFLEPDVPVGFLYLHDYRRPEFVEEVFRLCAERTTGQSVFVVEGIGYTRAMRRLWRRMQQHGRVGVTFDLYDLGILFFDRTKNKQHYVVNFGL